MTLALALSGAALIGCADTTTNPMAAAPRGPGRDVIGCTIFGDTGCPTASATIDIASVDVAGGSFVGTDGIRYYATDLTRFYPAQLPPNPIFPNDPMYARLGAWNSLIGTSASFRAYLGVLNALPPNPILPPNPVRLGVVTEIVGTSYFLTDVTPIVGP